MQKTNVLFLLMFVVVGCGGGGGSSTPTAVATNRSSTTQCAESDNVNIPLAGDYTSLTIEATHPTYDVGTGSCDPDFANCVQTEPSYTFEPLTLKLFDDGDTVVEAVRQATWWRPNGMSASVNSDPPVTDVHFVRIYRKIAGENEWPQYLVLYMDGNLRIIPHPPEGMSSVCFGSSVIIGPAESAPRPIAEIASVRYESATRLLKVTFSSGGSAVITLQRVDRTLARVQVDVQCTGNTLPLVTFRSMFVEEGNADVDHVKWRDAAGNEKDSPVLALPDGKGTEWLFYRIVWSKHNTSAPDIRIRLR